MTFWILAAMTLEINLYRIVQRAIGLYSLTIVGLSLFGSRGLFYFCLVVSKGLTDLPECNPTLN